jgi:hypothetical protein
VFQFLGSVRVVPGEWVYSNPLPGTYKRVRLTSRNLPSRGRATLCLYEPAGQSDFKRFYPDNEAVLITLPPASSVVWRRMGLRGTSRVSGVWIVNIEYETLF